MELTKDACGCCDVCPLALGEVCDPEHGEKLTCAGWLKCERSVLAPGERQESLTSLSPTRTGRCVWKDPEVRTEPME